MSRWAANFGWVWFRTDDLALHTKPISGQLNIGLAKASDLNKL